MICDIKICHESTIVYMDRKLSASRMITDISAQMRVKMLTAHCHMRNWSKLHGAAELCQHSCFWTLKRYTLWMRTGCNPFLASFPVSLLRERADKQAACAVVCRSGFDSITAFTADLNAAGWNIKSSSKGIQKQFEPLGQKVILMCFKKTICVRKTETPFKTVTSDFLFNSVKNSD